MYLLFYQEQYYFLHCVCDEMLQTRAFICAPVNIETKLDIYAGVTSDGKDLITEEFQVNNTQSLFICLLSNTKSISI